MVGIDDLRDFVGVDYTDDMTDRNLQRALSTAKATVCGSIGEQAELDQYLPGDPRVDDLILHYAADAYLDRDLTGKEGAAVKGRVAQMELQLRQELRRKKAVLK